MLFTTRIGEVAMHADPSCPFEEIFPLENGPFPCPLDLKALGFTTSHEMPLAIVILEGLLSRKQKTAQPVSGGGCCQV